MVDFHQKGKPVCVAHAQGRPRHGTFYSFYFLSITRELFAISELLRVDVVLFFLKKKGRTLTVRRRSAGFSFSFSSRKHVVTRRVCSTSCPELPFVGCDEMVREIASQPDILRIVVGFHHPASLLVNSHVDIVSFLLITSFLEGENVVCLDVGRHSKTVPCFFSFPFSVFLLEREGGTSATGHSIGCEIAINIF
ncbi:hypothetical protein GHT06_017560 [Daphnia sinensis]|uniref:Uncharacterized protein n=1 Tax=Daphnia sinensis TaxID=1820382 RepID=A0AAD5PRZ6_9CRUS|nr:hypothetical protein GHT06_017560 [Daphnia sinensis]